MKICKYVHMIAYDIGIIEQKKAVLRVIVDARSCERWLCNMLDKDRCTCLSDNRTE